MVEITNSFCDVLVSFGAKHSSRDINFIFRHDEMPYSLTRRLELKIKRQYK